MTEPQWVAKVWGRTRCLEDSPEVSCHELEVIYGGYCSIHYHKHRSNVFQVEYGKIRVVYLEGLTIKERILDEERNVFSVPAKMVHQFQVLRGGRLKEYYLPDPGPVDNNDIIRLTEGARSSSVDHRDRPFFLDQYAKRLKIDWK